MRRFLVFLMFAAVACGDDSSPKSSANNATNNNATDAGVDVVEDSTPAVMCPDEGEIFCGGKCVNGQISVDHCGACGNSCQLGAQTCREGSCVCLNGKDLCGNRCYDLTSTHDNCGACGNACSASEACVDSACIFVNDRAEVLGVLEYTNSTRAAQQDCGVNGIKNSVGPLQLNEILSIAAQGHAEDMAANNFMAHEGSDGSSPSQRADRAGYRGRGVGENVARGYETPAAVVQGWTDSDGHCSNMMNGSYSEIGIGYAASPSTGEEFWVQLFGSP